jgi:hypothetical protein
MWSDLLTRWSATHRGKRGEVAGIGVQLGSPLSESSPFSEMSGCLTDVSFSFKSGN